MASTIQHIACHRCDAALAIQIDACPHCGAKTTIEAPRPAAAAAKDQAGKWDWIHRRRTVLFVLLCATGALGLPALWLSRAFSTQAKIIWSIIVTAETTLLVWLCYRSVQMAIDAIEPLLD
jgi:rRNA maturation protein Nop10